MGKSWVETSTSFVLDFGTFLFYFYFYMFGWILFKSKHLLNTFMRYDWAFTITGTLIYTVYLLHLPLTAFLPGLIGEWNLPAVVKFLIVVVITTIICFVTYNYFVRSTFIGKFLNGRKYSRNLSDIRKAEAISALKPVAIKNLS